MASDEVVAGPNDGFSIVRRKGRYHFVASVGVRRRGLSLSDVYVVEELIKKLRDTASKVEQGNIFPEE